MVKQNLLSFIFFAFLIEINAKKTLAKFIYLFVLVTKSSTPLYQYLCSNFYLPTVNLELPPMKILKMNESSVVIVIISD